LTRAHVLSFLLNDWEEFKGNIYVKNMWSDKLNY
jgi:hypothetical protein